MLSYKLANLLALLLALVAVGFIGVQIVPSKPTKAMDYFYVAVIGLSLALLLDSLYRVLLN